MTTGEAIKNFCKECVNSNQTKIIKDCNGEYVRATKKPCALFKYRLKGKGTIKAIRRNCVDCMGGSFSAVDECTTETCPLYGFKSGKFAKIAGTVARVILQDQFKPKTGITARVN
jgi:hypothetical protein